MNRPLALIEGDLALPSLRPFDALPPPFGSRRRQAQATAQREPQALSPTAAQQAVQNALQRQASPPRRGVFPPGVKFLFFYKRPRQRDHSHQFEEQLAEARYYLDSGRVRPSSTRSDHILGGVIFAGCSIVLGWLLATCTTHDADKATTTATAQLPVEVARTAQRSAPQAARAALKATAPDAPTSTDATLKTVPPNTRTRRHVDHLVPLPTARVSARQVAPSGPTKAHGQVPIARFSKPQIDQRLTLSRAVNSATQPSVSKQREWTARSSSANDTAERAALLDWAVQQRRANITTRASLPVADDADWNARMTQRRIIDNPDAFKSDRTQK